MSLGAVTGLVRELRRVDRESRSRPPGAARGDLLAQAARAERVARELCIPDLMAVAALRIGDILLASDDPERAERAFLQAEAALQGLRKADLAVVVAARHAKALAALHRWDEVERVAGAGIELVERYRYKASSPFLQAAYLKSRIPLYSLGAMAALRRSDIGTALQRCELAKARGVLADAVEADEAKAHLPEDVRVRLASVSQALERAEGRADQPTAGDLRAQRQALWDLLMMKRRRRRTDTSPHPPFTLATLQAKLAPDHAVLYHFWVQPTRLLQVVVDHRRVWFDTVAVEPDEARELDAYAGRILSAGSDEVEPPDDLLNDVRLFNRLLWPTHPDARAILAGGRRIVASPHRKLHPLPLHALKHGGRFLIETHAFRFVPNLTCLLQPPADRRGGAVFAIGVGDYAVPGLSLRPLAESEREAEAVAALYHDAGRPATALIGPRASAEALRRGLLAGADCVHFACHGKNVDPQSPMEACLYLRDSKIEGIELPLMDLRAHLVVLTACCSGQRWLSGRDLDELPGDDVMGLQAAFFAAGAREILSTLCPVKDLAGMRIGTGFHRHHLSGAPSDLAWQAATIEYLATAKLPERHRAFWAPFQLLATTL
jgi:CHAT domain-containing protein